ncbi:MAG: SpoIID/LytB domain-containing protein [Planctomycetota bacterium]|nr:SpoIID/LytB domain-containing protein [Planctomycetota bacterium]
MGVRGVAACVLLIAALGACRSTPSSPTVASLSATGKVRGPAKVRVRLAEVDGARELRVLGDAGDPVTFERAGEFVRRGDGRLARDFRLAPADSDGALTLAATPYPGELWIAARPSGGLRVENRVDLEQYVAGVVAGELALWSAEPAELEAQAVAARTYAVASLLGRGPGGFLWDDVRDQVYAGRHVPDASDGGRAAARRLERALGATRGLALFVGDDLLDARYHAACGGSTARTEDVFGAATGPGSPAVDCAPCARSERDRWEWTAPAADLARAAGALDLGERLESLVPERVDAAGRWLSVRLHGPSRRRTVELTELRGLLDPERLASAGDLRTWPPPGRPITGGLHFSGRGRGHGVGLCQEGARGYARMGWDYERILSHYYPGATLETLGR